MRKLIITLVVAFMALTPSPTNAQSVIDGLYSKYAGKPGFTSINISPEMFQMLSGFNMNDSSKDAVQSQDVIRQLKGLKMLVYEPKDSTKVPAFYREIKKMVPTVGFKDLMTIDSHNGKLNFLAHLSRNGKIKELLMIDKGPHEAMIMSLTGLIDMKTISEISKSVNIHGMNDLQKLNKRNEKK